MESIKENIDKFQMRSTGKKFNAEWEFLADEMTDYFGENCYWLFYKKEDWKIRNAFNACKGKRIRSFRYLMGILKNNEQ